MAKINDHHIIYDAPPWEVELTGQQHRVITVIQNTRASGEQYARVTNFMHSVAHEWNRMRRELDTGMDLRTRNPDKEEKQKRKKQKF